MPQAPNIDGVLITWGDRLFYPGNRVVSCGLSQRMEKWDNKLSSMLISKCNIMNFVQTSASWILLHIRNNMHAPIRKHMPTYKLIVGRNKFSRFNQLFPKVLPKLFEVIGLGESMTLCKIQGTWEDGVGQR